MTVVRSLSKKAGGGALATPTDLEPAHVAKVAAALNQVLADAFVLYLKTKNFHWHVSGKHFRDYHLLLDEQAGTIQMLEQVQPEQSAPLTMLLQL